MILFHTDHGLCFASTIALDSLYRVHQLFLGARIHHHPGLVSVSVRLRRLHQPGLPDFGFTRSCMGMCVQDPEGRMGDTGTLLGLLVVEGNDVSPPSHPCEAPEDSEVIQQPPVALAPAASVDVRSSSSPPPNQRVAGLLLEQVASSCAVMSFLCSTVSCMSMVAFWFDSCIGIEVVSSCPLPDVLSFTQG